MFDTLNVYVKLFDRDRFWTCFMEIAAQYIGLLDRKHAACSSANLTVG